MTEREPMSNEERLRKALEASRRSVVDDGHIYLSTPERLMSLQDEVSVFLASTEPEQPSGEEEDYLQVLRELEDAVVDIAVNSKNHSTKAYATARKKLVTLLRQGQ